MAEHIHKTYTCDRCKAPIGSELPGVEYIPSIKARFTSLKKSAHHFEWQHLCDPCDAAVRAFFLFGPVEMAVTQSERREARVWWAEVASYVNKDMAEYIMVRAKRIMGGWNP